MNSHNHTDCRYSLVYLLYYHRVVDCTVTYDRYSFSPYSIALASVCSLLQGVLMQPIVEYIS